MKRLLCSALLAAAAASPAPAGAEAPSGGTPTAGLHPSEGDLKPFLGQAELEIQQVFKGGRFPNVAVATDGTVLAVWGSVVARRSEDGGESWGPEVVVGKGHMGGGVTVNETNGDIFAFVGQGHPPTTETIYRSQDHGKTWQAVKVEIRPDSLGHKPEMHMNESGITLRHGKHRGRLIRAARYYGLRNDRSEWPAHYTNAIFSDDGGKTWLTSDPFPANGTGEAAVAELSDGTIYYNSRRHWAPEGANPLRRWTAWSRDGGTTWNDLSICEILPDGPQNTAYGCMGGLVRLPVAGKDILIYSNCDSPSGRDHGTVWASFDGGKSWPLKRLVTKGGFAYSSLAAGRPGTKSEGWIYLLSEGGGGQLARFNLNWLLAGEKTGDGEVPGGLFPLKSTANEHGIRFDSAYQKLNQQVERLDHMLKPVFADKLLLAESLLKRQSEDLKNMVSVDREILVHELSQLLHNTSVELDVLKTNMSYDKHLKGKTLSVKDFGAVGNGQHDDGPALRMAIHALKTKGEGWRLWLPLGDYVVLQLEPQINYHLTVNHLDNCVIEGAPGTRIITSKAGGGIIFDKCYNSRLKNITLDCRDQAPASQGTIVSANKDDNTIDIQLDENAARPDQEYFAKASYLRGLAYDMDTESVVLPFIDPRIKWIKKVDDFYRLKLMNSQQDSPAGYISPYRKGHVFAIHARQTRGAGQALEIRDSEHITIEGVAVNASFGIGIISNASDATTLIECKIERKPASGRYWVSNADGIIVKDNRIGPMIYKCSVRHVNDDCINIHSSFYSAVSFEPAKGNELLIAHQLGKAGQPGTEYDATKFRQGDKLAIVNPNDGSTSQILTMKSAVWSEWNGQPALKLILDQPLEKIVSRESLGKGDIDAREYVYGSDTEVEHFVVNLNTKSNGFVIKNCFLGENRTKCILLKTGNGVISNNQLVLKHGIGIRMVGELNWMNGDACHNVIIKDNTIDANTSILSSFFLARKNPEVAVLNNSNITIRDNVINSNRGIEIYYSRDVNIINNKIKSNPPQLFVDHSMHVAARNNCLKNKNNHENGVTEAGDNNWGNIVLEKSKCD